MTAQMPIPILRKRADAACKDLAKLLKECPETIWAEATQMQFPPEEWTTADNDSFWDAFTELHWAEKEALTTAAA